LGKSDINLSLKIGEGRTKRVMRTVLSKRNMARYMKVLASDIRIRTRLGYNALKSGGKRTKLKPLKPSTKKGREYLKRRGGLSGLTKPARSNLTRTEQMLNALRGLGKGTGKGVVEVKASGRSDSKETNAAVAGYAEDHGRPFLNLTSKEVKELKQNIKKDIVKQFKK